MKHADLVPEHSAKLLMQTHRDQLVLCHRLEFIADSLPYFVDRQACIGVAQTLGPLIHQAHRLEEDIVFPAVRDRWKALINIDKTLERLRDEHLEDEGFAEELHDALMAYGCGENRPGPEAFGYMLRGFFEGLRRHIAFEKEMILPLFSMTSSAVQTVPTKPERVQKLG